MIMPAMAPPLTEELFFVVVEPEVDPSLLPVELELDAEEDVDFVLVDDAVESVGDVTCESEEVLGTDVT